VLLAGSVLAVVPAGGAGAQSALPAQRTFVSNAGQSTGSDVGWGHDFAQAFTTGSNSAGYSLRSVELRVRSIASGFSSSWLTAAVHADSGGSPGSVVGTLDNPPIAANSNLHALRFTSAGIDLGPGTTYWLVLDVGADAGASRMVLTGLTVEDAGALPGWSIGDVASARAWSSTGTFSPIGGGGFVLRVALGGTVKCPSMWTFSNAGVSVSYSGAGVPAADSAYAHTASGECAVLVEEGAEFTLSFTAGAPRYVRLDLSD